MTPGLASSGAQASVTRLLISGPPGDVSGLRQSGQPRLRASALLDGQLIITTKAEAEAVLDRDATLEQPEHAGLRRIAAQAESGIIGEAH